MLFLVISTKGKFNVLQQVDANESVMNKLDLNCRPTINYLEQFKYSAIQFRNLKQRNKSHIIYSFCLKSS